MIDNDIFNRHFPGKEWYKLPLALRQQWWEETDFNRLEPTNRLLRIIQEAFDGRSEATTERDNPLSELQS